MLRVISIVGTQEDLEEQNFIMGTRDCSCDILMKNVAAFCPCLKSLPENKVKRFRLIALAKEISKQPTLDFVLWFITSFESKNTKYLV